MLCARILKWCKITGFCSKRRIIFSLDLLRKRFLLTLSIMMDSFNIFSIDTSSQGPLGLNTPFFVPPPSAPPICNDPSSNSAKGQSQFPRHTENSGISSDLNTPSSVPSPLIPNLRGLSSKPANYQSKPTHSLESGEPSKPSRTTAVQRGDMLGLYLKEIGRFPILTSFQERALAMRIVKARSLYHYFTLANPIGIRLSLIHI